MGGPDATRPYFGAGFSEDLARRMGHIRGLTVPGRLGLRALAGKGAQVAAQEVRASLALLGRVTPADEDWKTLQFDVRLVDRTNTTPIWTRSYTASAQDVISLQARITTDVAAWLRVAHKPTAEQGRASLRLVRELDRTGRIPAEALERAFEALRDFRSVARGSGVRRIVAAVFVLQIIDQGLNQRPSRWRLALVECLGYHSDDQGRIANRLERNQEHTILEVALQLQRDLQRQPRLTRAAWPGERHHADIVALQQLASGGQFALAMR